MVWDSKAPNGGFSTAKPWLPVPHEHLAMAVSAQTGDAKSILEHYRRMLAFRRSHPALVAGAIRFIDAPEDVLAFVRSGGSEEIACLFNLSHAAQRVEVGAALTALDGTGFSAKPDADRRSVTLAPGQAFFGRLG